MEQNPKLLNSIKELEEALKYEKKAMKDSFFYAGIAKQFEVCFEYTWKEFKRVATKAGLEAYSPRDSIKFAGRLNLVDDVEMWFDFLENRNIAVHDYLGITKSEYLKSIRKFLIEIKEIVAK